ncbi:MAG: single-stranded DNA-binding protein [Rickettsiaceae bacterium H1]|nr:single-stranded DNA-binding protein [Rickettsiaceae bacterium H1]
MINSLNKVTLIGRLGKDPEIRTMQDSRQLAAFSVATSESWIDKNTNERVEKTDWHNIVIFNEKLVPIAQNYLHKGSKVYIEGSLKTRKWTDSNGNDRYTTEIVLQFNPTLIVLDNKNDTNDTGSKKELPGESQHQEFKEDEELIDDEIPF